MSPISHALFPLAVGRSWLPTHGARPSLRASLLVAAFGVLPDALDPHVFLPERLASWSHTLAAGLGVALLTAIATRARRAGFDGRIATLCALAYLAHLACDAVSGGVVLFRPLSLSVVGGHYITPVWWLACDAALLLWAYATYRWIPLTARQRQARTEALSGD